MAEGYRGRLILIGDHCQLPPVVGETEEPDPLPEVLIRGGLNEGETLKTSMFERLARLNPEAMTTLAEQYRMSAPICRLISETFYDGRLKPGSESVAQATLEDWYDRLGTRPGLTGWIAQALDPSIPVLFLDTSNDPAARDSSVSLGGEESRENGREAGILARLVSEFVGAMPESAREAAAAGIGVVSPYRRQNNRIRRELAARGPEALQKTRVDTVDRFQGGEKPLLCVSLTSSNAAGSVGKLHQEWRRMNVALSRAQYKLVLIGDRETFTAQAAGASPEVQEAR
jgi:DNA replication ATP-dependent helicase Dna2